jgi:hypothetical protein
MTLIPTQIIFRGIAPSAALEDDIRERIAWLEQFYRGIVGCRVRVEVPHRHRRSGRDVNIHLEVTVPGGPPVVVSHTPSLHASLKDVGEPEHRKDAEIERVHRYALVAVRDAFDAARRQLQDFAREQRGAVKTHEQAAP